MMRSALILGPMVCLLAVLSMRPAEAASPHAQIRARIDAMALAAKAHDTDAFLEPFMRGPRLVFVINGEVILGWNALRAAQLKWWRNGASDARYRQISPTRFMDVAPGVVVTTQQLVSRRKGPDGKTQENTFAVSTVWRRLHDGWRIVYASESWAQ